MRQRPSRFATAVGITLAAAVAFPIPTLAQDEGTASEPVANGFLDFEVEFVSPDDVDTEITAMLHDALGGRIRDSDASVEVPPDTYSFSLSDPGPEWKVTKIDCESTLGTSVTVVDLDSRSALIDLAPEDIVQCFVTVASGIAQFDLMVKPPGQDLKVDATIETEDGVQSTASTSELMSGHQVRFGPGTHTATLSDPGLGWSVTEALCIDTSEGPNASSGDEAARVATVGMDPAEFVQCDFTVEKNGKLILKTVTRPKGSEKDFSYLVSQAGSDDQLGARGVRPTNTASLRVGIGAAVLLEPGERWRLDDVRCRERDKTTGSSGNKGAASAVLGIDADDEVTCTFTLTDMTAPRAGAWSVSETSARARNCPDNLVPEKGESAKGKLRVGDRGQRLVATGFSQGRVNLNRRGDSGRYQGRKRRAKIVYQVTSDTRMTGTNTVNLGKGCTVTRAYDMRFLGK